MSLSGDTHPTIWLDSGVDDLFCFGFWAFWGIFGRAMTASFIWATSLYRSVDGSRLSLIRDLSKRGVYVPIVGCD